MINSQRSVTSLHAASSYPLTSRGNTAPFMEEMLGAIARRGHEVSIVVPRVAGLAEGSRQGINVVGAPYAPQRLQTWGYGRSLDANGRLRPSALAMTPVAIASMARILRHQIRIDQPDIVHLHWALPQGILALAISSSIPTVVSLHGADARFFSGRLKPIVRQVLKRADAVVAASSAIVEAAVGLSPEVAARCYVIPHGAEGSLFGTETREHARNKLGLGDTSRLVLGVGRLVPKKGFEYLIQSIPHLHADVRVVIVGDGPQRSDLETIAQDVDIGRVDFIGALGREELAVLYSAADVVAIPSVPVGGDIDSGPVVLMEAMSAGRPVVATKIGMAPDLIDDDVNGYLVDSDQPEQLAAAIDRALASADRLGRGARQTFEAVGDWSRVATELEGVYREAIDRRQHLRKIH